MRSSVERRKLQRCVACYLKSSINLLSRLLKETCWTSQLACNVCLRKIFKKHFPGSRIGSCGAYKRTLLPGLIVGFAAGSGERRAELRRSTRKLRSIIKVRSWRLYNVYNQQNQKFVFNNLVVYKA